MSPNQVYESFIIKANANAQTDNVSVDRGRFVKIFNEASNKFVEWILEKQNGDEIDYIQALLTTTKITNNIKKEGYQLFALPKNFFDLSTVSARATGGCCENISMTLTEIKSGNEDVILNDSASEPSIDYRETSYYLEGGKVKIFTKDFNIDSATVTFYKYPEQISIIEEDDPESQFKDSDKELKLDNKALDRIISIATADYSLNTSNPKFQLDKSRVVTKF